MSAVWNFFTKNGLNQPVSCNLCGNTYKTCGNTTNLATHLKTKHYNAFVQLSKSQKVKPGNGTKDGMLVDDDDPDLEGGNLLSATQRKKSISEDSSDSTDTHNFTREIAKKRKQSTLESCLERSLSFEEGGQKHTDITQALIYMICKDNMPLSCVEKVGLQKFTRTVSPLFKLPSRRTVTRLIENRYSTTKAILVKVLDEADFLCFTSDILTITNSTRSFLVMTVHFIGTNKKNNSSIIESINLCAQKLSQSHTAEYIKRTWSDICNEFGIEKSKIVSITTDGGANMVAAVKSFLGDDRRIPCLAHKINLIIDGVLREISTFSELCDHVKSIVTFFKQSVNASDQLRSEQEASGKKEGEVSTLTQAVSTRWNSCLDMLKRFVELSALVAKILAMKSQTNKKTPDMVPTSQLNIIRDLITLLGPFKEATEEVSGDNYVTASLAIPVSNLLSQVINQSSPSTSLGETVKEALSKRVEETLMPLENNSFLSVATILDPRFKRLHFTSPRAVSNAISRLSNDIRLEHKRRGQKSPDPKPSGQEAPAASSSSLWCRHEKLITLSTSRAEVPSSGCVPNELKQYLEQPLIERKSDPIEFWVNCRHFTPVLSEIALKYLICQASSVSSERLASAVNLAVPDNRSRLTGEHIKERVLLMSISDDYWFK